MTCTGAAGSLDLLVIDELYASGREAIINAFKHSGAKTVRVTESYSRDGASVAVSDDGKGIDPKVLSSGGVAGHWGLRGMYERMSRIGGSCRILSEGISGTTVGARPPARQHSVRNACENACF